MPTIYTCLSAAVDALSATTASSPALLAQLESGILALKSLLTLLRGPSLTADKVESLLIENGVLHHLSAVIHGDYDSVEHLSRLWALATSL